MYVHFSMMTMTEYMWTNLPPTVLCIATAMY